MYNIPANSPRIDARTRKTKPGKVNLYIYAITVSSEAIMKLPRKENNPLGVCCHKIIQEAIDKGLTMK
jgi:hypothetical protein